MVSITPVAPETPVVPAAPVTPAAPPAAITTDLLVDALRKGNRTFFGTALARAQFALDGDGVIITLGGNFEQQRVEARRGWIEQTIAETCGRRLRVATKVAPASAPERPAGQPDAAQLRQQALQSEAVQAMLDVFPADIRDVEQLG